MRQELATLLFQGVISLVVLIAATFVALESPDQVPGEALVGLYASALAYVFGLTSGIRIGRRNNNHNVIEKTLP